MSLLSDLGTKIGTELKGFDDRIFTLENAPTSSSLDSGGTIDGDLTINGKLIGNSGNTTEGTYEVYQTNATFDSTTTDAKTVIYNAQGSTHEVMYLGDIGPGDNSKAVFTVANNNTSGDNVWVDQFKVMGGGQVYAGGERIYTNTTKPAFSVYGSVVWNNIGNPYPTESEAVKIGEVNGSAWNTVDVNVGNHFDISNGRFTAPVAGTYFFTFGASLVQGDGSEQNDSKICFFKNGSVYRYLFQETELQATENAGDLPQVTSISLIMQLNAGDYVHAGFATNVTAKFTTGIFSGYMI